MPVAFMLLLTVTERVQLPFCAMVVPVVPMVFPPAMPPTIVPGVEPGVQVRDGLGVAALTSPAG